MNLILSTGKKNVRIYRNVLPYSVIWLHVYKDKNGLRHELQRDYYISCLILSAENEQTNGLWGTQRLDFSIKSSIIYTYPQEYRSVTMKQCMDADNLHRRLKKIIGQVQAIDRMIDEDIPCEDVLSQLNAAKSALHKCGQVVLEGHIKHCVKDGIEHGDADKTIEKFTKAVERFANMG